MQVPPRILVGQEHVGEDVLIYSSRKDAWAPIFISHHFTTFHKKYNTALRCIQYVSVLRLLFYRTFHLTMCCLQRSTDVPIAAVSRSCVPYSCHRRPGFDSEVITPTSPSDWASIMGWWDLISKASMIFCDDHGMIDGWLMDDVWHSILFDEFSWSDRFFPDQSNRIRSPVFLALVLSLLFSLPVPEIGHLRRARASDEVDLRIVVHPDGTLGPMVSICGFSSSDATGFNSRETQVRTSVGTQDM